MTTLRSMRLPWLLLLVSLGACAVVDQQIGAASSTSCIQKNCRDPDARDYTQCEAACRAQYAR